MTRLASGPGGAPPAGGPGSEKRALALFRDPGSLERLDGLLVAPTTAYVGEQFTERIEEYERLADFHGAERQRLAREQLERWLEPLALVPRSTVLEIGAGTGQFTHAFLDLGLPFSTYVLNDVSAPILRRCRDLLAEEDLAVERLTFFCGDIGERHFRPGSFDLVFGNSVLHHVLDVEDFVGLVYEILRPGGLFVVAEPFARGHLIVAIVLQLMTYLESVRGRPLEPEDAATIDSFCTNLHSRAQRLFSSRDIAELDDKHLFWEHDLRQLSRRLGFASVELLPVARGTGELAMASGENPGPVQRACEQILRDLDIEPPSEFVTVAALFDRLFPSLLTRELPLRQALRLRK